MRRSRHRYRAAPKAADAPSCTLDAMYAVGVAFRILAQVMPYRDDLRALPKYDIGHLDRLEDTARALRFVHAELQRQLRRPGVSRCSRGKAGGCAA